MLKKYSLLFLFVLFVLPAQPEQEYTVTETELMKLEKISQEWEMRTQRHLSTVRKLNKQLQQAEANSKNLNENLKTERTIRQHLRKSYAKLEGDLLSEIDELKTENANDKLTIQKLWTAIIILGSIICLFGAYIIFKIIVKFKK